MARHALTRDVITTRRGQRRRVRRERGMAAAVVRSGRRLAALLRAGTGPRVPIGERGAVPYRSAPGPGCGCGPGPCPALGRRSPVRTKHSRPAAGLRVPSGPFRGSASVRAAARRGEGNRAACRAAVGRPRAALLGRAG